MGKGEFDPCPAPVTNASVSQLHVMGEENVASLTETRDNLSITPG